MGNQEKKGDFESCMFNVGLEAPDFLRSERRLSGWTFSANAFATKIPYKKISINCKSSKCLLQKARFHQIESDAAPQYSSSKNILPVVPSREELTCGLEDGKSEDYEYQNGA